MTIALSSTTAPASQSTTLARSSTTTSGLSFGGLLNASLSTSGTDAASALRALFNPSTPAATTPLAENVSSALSDLEDRLAEALELAADDAAPGSELLAAIGALITQAAALVGQPGERSAGGLSELDPTRRGALDALLDRVATLSTRLADSLGDDPATPQLTLFARLLDRHAAALPDAPATENPDMLARLARAETTQQLPPPATDASSTKPVSTDTSEPGRSERTEKADPPKGAPETVLTRTAAEVNGTAATRPMQAELMRPGSSQHRPVETDDIIAAGPVATAPLPHAQPHVAASSVTAFARADTPLNLPYVAAEIARHVQNGMSRFEIRLNPPEMGRIDVRLEFDNSGNVTARLAVERAETLDLMQRDQRALERALAQAGLDAGKTNLEFSLKGEGDRGGFAQNDRDDRSGRGARSESSGVPDTAETTASAVTHYRGFARADAVNLWI